MGIENPILKRVGLEIDHMNECRQSLDTTLDIDVGAPDRYCSLVNKTRDFHFTFTKCNFPCESNLPARLRNPVATTNVYQPHR